MSTTATATELEPSVVKTTLNYYLEPSIGGHDSYQVGTASYYRRKFDPHDVTINNLRGKEDQFKLDSHGFQHVRHSSAERTFDDNERVKSVVYPETEQLIKEM